MPDNAVMDAPVTAAEPEAPPSLEMPETEPTLAPETEAAPETPESEEQAESTGWEGLTAEEIETRVAERVEAARKDAKARADESHRRQLENQQTEAKTKADQEAYYHGMQLGSDQARRARFQQGYQALAGALKSAFDTGKDAPDPQTIAQVAGWLTTQAEADVRYQMHDHYARERLAVLHELFPDYRASAELIDMGRRAQAAFNYADLAKVDGLMYAEAANQSAGTKAAARVTAEAAAKAAAAAKAPAPRKPATSPTGATAVGGDGRRPTTQREADQALMAARNSGDSDRVRAAMNVVRESRKSNWPW